VAVVRSYSGGVTICYVVPVLWMMSRFAVWRNMEAELLGDHERRCDTVAEPDVHECLFIMIFS